MIKEECEKVHGGILKMESKILNGDDKIYSRKKPLSLLNEIIWLHAIKTKKGLM